MKIWDSTTGAAGYDDQPAIALTGGDIVIHPVG